MPTTIQISDNVKSVLDRMKMIERETYNDIIERMIEDDLELNEKTKTEIEDHHLAGLSIVQLFNISISIVLKKEETIASSPGIVSTYRIQDLKKLGLTTLKDIISFIPGSMVMDTHLGNTSIAIRGISENFNQKILFLIEGVPYWMPSHGDIPLVATQ